MLNWMYDKNGKRKANYRGHGGTPAGPVPSAKPAAYAEPGLSGLSDGEVFDRVFPVQAPDPSPIEVRVAAANRRAVHEQQDTPEPVGLEALFEAARRAEQRPLDAPRAGDSLNMELPSGNTSPVAQFHTATRGRRQDTAADFDAYEEEMRRLTQAGHNVTPAANDIINRALTHDHTPARYVTNVTPAPEPTGPDRPQEFGPPPPRRYAASHGRSLAEFAPDLVLRYLDYVEGDATAPWVTPRADLGPGVYIPGGGDGTPTAGSDSRRTSGRSPTPEESKTCWAPWGIRATSDSRPPPGRRRPPSRSVS